MEFRFSPLSELRRALDSGMVSVEELAQDYLAALEKETLGACLSILPELTLSQARQCQSLLEKTPPEQRSPLLGLPVIHKDVLVTKDWPTTAGSKFLKNYQSPFNAHAVDLLQSAGMVCLGKSNCDEFAMGSANEHSAYKPACNPWDTNRIPGGSSGGRLWLLLQGLHRLQREPIPGARFVSPPPCVALRALSQPTDGSRVGGLWPMHQALIRPGPWRERRRTAPGCSRPWRALTRKTPPA